MVPPTPADATAAARAAPLLLRLPEGWAPAAPEPGVPLPPQPATVAVEAPAFDWAREAARHVGTVAHRLFAWIATDGPAAWPAPRLAALAPWIRGALLREGVDDAELGAAAAQVERAATRLLMDRRGRWLVDPAHPEARSEWALAGVDDGAIVHAVLDRTFVADGVRWIVDFKIGGHEGADVAAFLDHEVERYRGQLERYARLVRALEPRPIRLGLYHPLVGGWREWPYPA
jgi:hypothetical protein